MLKVVTTPERENQTRVVMIQDEKEQIVAVMNVRPNGWEAAAQTALVFVEAESNKQKLDEALVLIRGLRIELAERRTRALLQVLGGAQ
jgi:hypothetical protein